MRTPRTFKEGVEEFWAWFPTVAQRFYETIEDGRCGDLSEETVKFMERHLPHLAWAFGPGADGGHSFTVSGEGLLLRQLLAECWLEEAVDLPNWTFYGSRQPSPRDELENYAIQIGEHEQIDTSDFLIQTNVDPEEELIHITAWHPLLKQVPQEHHTQILFLLLDEALGEFGTQTWIGSIELEPFDPESEHVHSLTQLPNYIDSVQKYHQWEKLAPPKSFSVYQLNEQLDCPRGDTIAGSSIVASTFCEFLSNGGRLEDNPLQGTGAKLAYLSMDSRMFPSGQEAESRGNMEEAIEEALVKQRAGKALGGAAGIEQSYIDLLLLDGQNSIDIVQQQIQELQIANAKIHFVDS